MYRQHLPAGFSVQTAKYRICLTAMWNKHGNLPQQTSERGFKSADASDVWLEAEQTVTVNQV